MQYVVIHLAALLVSMLTLFSGFGLGTIMIPVLALCFPSPVAAIAVVHLATTFLV